MPLLIALGLLSGICICCTIKDGGKNTKPFTQEEIKRMNYEMVGKSKSERRKIFNKYK